MNPLLTKPIEKKKRSRAERKAAQREQWKLHPVKSGVVRIIDYVPPR